MKKYVALSIFVFSIVLPCLGQKINTDSLLVEATKSLKSEHYEKAIEQGRLGIKISPDYYDFHMLLGRVFTKTKKVESAQYYFKQVIENAPVYKDAFMNLIKLGIDYGNYDDALTTIQKAFDLYPDEKELYLSKLKIFQLKGDEEATITYLEQLVEKYPGDGRLRQIFREEKSKHVSNRIGIDHSFSTFDRDVVGPWHLTGLQYVRERKPLTLIARINYSDRRSQGESLISGYQFGLESYIKTGKKGVSYLAAYQSGDALFPKLLLSASYFYYFDSGWEADLGGRYIKTSVDTDIYVAAIGTGKYLGSSWLNLKSFLFFDNGQKHPAVNGTFRYYFNTKYDYLALMAGYGSSPDESPNIIQFDERATLDSYRIGAAYNKLFGDHVITGIQFIFNRQEYVVDKKQNQFDVFVSLQYKL